MNKKHHYSRHSHNNPPLLFYLFPIRNTSWSYTYILILLDMDILGHFSRCGQQGRKKLIHNIQIINMHSEIIIKKD